MADAFPLEALYRGHPHLPYAHYPALDRERLERYAVERARRLLERHDVTPARHREPAGGLGVAAFQKQPFDTTALGMGAGSVPLLDLDATLLADRPAARRATRALALVALEAARASETSYVVARVDAREIAVVMGLEDAGFRTTDGILRFVFDLENPVPSFSGVTVRDALEADVPALRALAEQGFVYDRFHNDPSIPTVTADRLHGSWVENAVLGRYGSGVLVAEIAGEPAGFFILAEDALARDVLGIGIGTLVLITVSRAHRRLGVARALSLASLLRLKERKNRYAEVGTQIGNIPASNVYLASGFRLAQTSLTLRWCADDDR